MSSADTATKPGPEIIDITDLRNPILNDVQKGALAQADAYPVTFVMEEILAEAQAATGLSDFGALDFKERLQIWCEAVDDDPNVSGLGRHALRGMFLRYAAQRLRVEDYVKQHPEVLDIVIDRPIVVGGLPRSGTTHLVNLLGADPRLRNLPWWEAVAPVPGPEDTPTAEDPNPRRTREEKNWDITDMLVPYQKIMHEFTPDHISEDIELQCLDFSTYLMEWLVNTPRWRDYYLGHDQTGPYAYLKKVLKVLTHLKGPNRWAIKCPQHMEHLAVLYKTFPDATFVMTHRDPVASVQSAITQMAYNGRIFRKKVDADEKAAYWIDRYKRLLQRYVDQRPGMPDAQTIDVYFHEWTKDQDTILKQIYEKAQLPLTDEALAALHSWLAEHEHGYQGKVVYDLRRDFGLDPNEVRKEYQFYFDAYRVKPEVF